MIDDNGILELVKETFATMVDALNASGASDDQIALTIGTLAGTSFALLAEHGYHDNILRICLKAIKMHGDKARDVHVTMAAIPAPSTGVH